MRHVVVAVTSLDAPGSAAPPSSAGSESYIIGSKTPLVRYVVVAVTSPPDAPGSAAPPLSAASHRLLCSLVRSLLCNKLCMSIA